jgi:RHS repeat-associated protein
VDSAGGTITDVYDNRDRLTSETTAQGVISYTYDNVSRKTSMTVPCASGAVACAPVGYSYDNAGRLTQISQSGTTTNFAYDNAKRRTSLTLPNNVVVSYSYDNDSHLTGITYQIGSNTLGNLTYTYDQSGRRTQVGGSFARTGLPAAVSSARYDAANELLNWNGLALTYDANGNMLSDGANAFTWNARNQLAALNGRNLQYDANGRRIQNLVGTSFLYDGANIAQELSGSTVTANLLSGGIDEGFSRTDSSGAFTQLKDALGSTIALADSNGNVQTSYTYDPFGNTSASGAGNANVYQYTGRENENNGLYYYRARYYSPLLGRFISEDPLGFVGSRPNVYAYASDDPANLLDPLGLESGNLNKLVPGPDGEAASGSSSPPTILAGRYGHWWGDFWHSYFYQFENPHVCSWGAFGYGGGEIEAQAFGAEVSAELVGVIGYDSQEGGAHGAVGAVGASLGEGLPGISGGFETSRTWRDWQEHTQAIAFPADFSGHAPTIGGINFANNWQAGPLIQYQNGQTTIGGYFGGVKGDQTAGLGGYVNLGFKCGQ